MVAHRIYCSGFHSHTHVNVPKVIETNHLSYIGTNYDPDSVTAAGSSTCRYVMFISASNIIVFICDHRYCIGAVDRETGVMTLHKAEQFTLKPCVPGMYTIVHRMMNISNMIILYVR